MDKPTDKEWWDEEMQAACRLYEEGNIAQAVGKIDRTIAEAERRTWGEAKKEFIRLFCNDHNFTIRWMRGVAVDEKHLLEQILHFFDVKIDDPTEKLI